MAYPWFIEERVERVSADAARDPASELLPVLGTLPVWRKREGANDGQVFWLIVPGRGGSYTFGHKVDSI